jgi:hypothetical protein
MNKLDELYRNLFASIQRTLKTGSTKPFCNACGKTTDEYGSELTPHAQTYVQYGMPDIHLCWRCNSTFHGLTREQIEVFYLINHTQEG